MVRIVLVSLILTSALLALLLLGLALNRGMSWEHVSSRVSTDGSMTAKYYRSKSKAGHAPLGDHLVVESGIMFPTLFPGEIVFAGYCSGKLEYKWISSPTAEVLAVGCPEGSEVETIFSEYRGVKLNVHVQRSP